MLPRDVVNIISRTRIRDAANPRQRIKLSGASVLFPYPQHSIQSVHSKLLRMSFLLF